MEILELIHAQKSDFGGLCLLDTEPTQARPGHVMNQLDESCGPADDAIIL